MQKPKSWSPEWSKDRFEARQTLTCQTLILEFLHFRSTTDWEVAPATERTLQEFRNYLEQKKEELHKRGQYFAEQPKYNEDWIDEQRYENRWKNKNEDII